MAKLNRTLGVYECIFFGVGSILGAGIYTLIGKIAGWSGNLVWLSFLLASLTALCTAFSYAELSARFPKAGGEFEYAKQAFGKTAGIVLGSIVSLNGIISGATVSLGFAGYFSSLFGTGLILAALGIIILVFIINVTGIRSSSTVNIIFTLIEIAGLIFIISIALPEIPGTNYFEMPEKGTLGMMTAAALAFYAYIGFEEIVKLSEETKDPGKNIPIALFSASGIVILVYSLVAISVVAVVPYQQLAESESPLADVASKAFGNTGVIIISAIALFSTTNTILSNMLGSSRVLLNMGRETAVLKKFAKVSDRFKTPVTALVLILVIMLSFALIGKIETVATIANIFIFIAFIVVNLSVIVLRIKQPVKKSSFRIPGNINNIPVISIAAIIMILVLFAFNIYNLIET